MLPLYQVDSFCTRPFTGNPAAVCLLDQDRDDVLLQKIAAEMNLSETAFLLAQAPDSFDRAPWMLRWFTPTAEVDLCGHATLAAAFVLYDQGMVRADEVLRFDSSSGPLSAWRDGNQIVLDFPLNPPIPIQAPPVVIEALQADPQYVGLAGHDYVVELASETAVRQLRPNMAQLAHVSHGGVIITARSDNPEYDFVSRYFGPAIGIPEDPVTGSAHCALAPYWKPLLGKSSFRAKQLSTRGGELAVEIVGERVLLKGNAVLIFSGNLYVDDL